MQNVDKVRDRHREIRIMQSHEKNSDVNEKQKFNKISAKRVL